MSDAADGDDPGALHPQESIEKQSGEREVTEVVDAELQLKSIFGGGPRCPHYAGVVDQDVDLFVAIAQCCGGVVYGCEGREIQFLNRDIALWS